jgi:hypothetical protein
METVLLITKDGEAFPFRKDRAEKLLAHQEGRPDDWRLHPESEYRLENGKLISLEEEIKLPWTED